MQALPAPPPYHCVKLKDVSAGKVKMLLTASGDPAQIEAWLIDVKKHPVWRIDADAQSNGVRFVRLTGPGEVPYKEIGGIIYYGQVRHLAVAFASEPPICETEEK